MKSFILAAIGALAAAAPAAAQGTAYCFGAATCPCANMDPAAGCSNSTGSGALLSGSGSASVSSDDLVLLLTGCPTFQTAVFFMGPVEASVPFGDGLLCAGAGAAGHHRLITTTTGSVGTLSLGPGISFLSQISLPNSGGILPGATWHFQTWYQDAAGPCGNGVNFSNAYRVSFVP